MYVLRVGYSLKQKLAFSNLPFFCVYVCICVFSPPKSYLLAKEEFCMQTDSHMDFSEDWDEAMMKEWSATRNE